MVSGEYGALKKCSDCTEIELVQYMRVKLLQGRHVVRMSENEISRRILERILGGRRHAGNLRSK
jgi:hypothetical protein